MNSIEARMDASGLKIGVVVSRWNELITKELLDGALETLRSHGNPEVYLVKVPGTWEIPPVAMSLIEHKGVHAVVALGCILQGATVHAQMLAKDVSSALMSIQVETGIPVAWGVLTPDNPEQALERAGLKLGNKGREAALAAIEMASVLGQLK